MDSLVPVTDEQDVIVVPQFEAGFHGRCWLIMRDGRRMLKVPARITEGWKAADNGDIHFVVSDIDIIHAEEWNG